jgi:hypothetical protein
MKPSGQRAGTSEAASRAGQQQEGRLEGVVRAGLAEDLPAGAQYDRAISTDKVGEGLLVAVGRVPVEQFGVGRVRGVGGPGISGESE